MPPRFSSHCLHAVSTLAKLAQLLCTQLGIQVNWAGDWHTTPDGKGNRYLHSEVITLSILSLSHFTVCPPAYVYARYACPAVCRAECETVRNVSHGLRRRPN